MAPEPEPAAAEAEAGGWLAVVGPRAGRPSDVWMPKAPPPPPPPVPDAPARSADAACRAPGEASGCDPPVAGEAVPPGRSEEKALMAARRACASDVFSRPSAISLASDTCKMTA